MALHRHDRGVLALEELPAGRLVAQRLADLERDVVAALRARGEIHHRLFRFADLQPQRVAGNDLGVGRGEERGDAFGGSGAPCSRGRGRAAAARLVPPTRVAAGAGSRRAPAASAPASGRCCSARATYWQGLPGGGPRAARRAAARRAPRCSDARASAAAWAGSPPRPSCSARTAVSSLPSSASAMTAGVAGCSRRPPQQLQSVRIADPRGCCRRLAPSSSRSQSRPEKAAAPALEFARFSRLTLACGHTTSR